MEGAAAGMTEHTPPTLANHAPERFMNPPLPRLILSCLLLSAMPLAAQPGAAPFVASLDPTERQALGIETMTPAQLSALENAVARYLDRANSAPGPASMHPPDSPRASASLQQTPEPLSTTPGEPRKVMLAPGTEVTYHRTETTLVGPFAGWKKGTLFRLANGQAWRVLEGNYWAKEEAPGKHVTVEPGAFGSFFIKFEGISKRPRVALVPR
jgi:hypothetical protein